MGTRSASRQSVRSCSTRIMGNLLQGSRKTSIGCRMGMAKLFETHLFPVNTVIHLATIDVRQTCKSLLRALQSSSTN
jgi:hypothetical protein